MYLQAFDVCPLTLVVADEAAGLHVQGKQRVRLGHDALFSLHRFGSYASEMRGRGRCHGFDCVQDVSMSHA